MEHKKLSIRWRRISDPPIVFLELMYMVFPSSCIDPQMEKLGVGISLFDVCNGHIAFS
jgi:hypothetical protein